MYLWEMQPSHTGAVSQLQPEPMFSSWRKVEIWLVVWFIRKYNLWHLAISSFI